MDRLKQTPEWSINVDDVKRDCQPDDSEAQGLLARAKAEADERAKKARLEDEETKKQAETLVRAQAAVDEARKRAADAVQGKKLFDPPTSATCTVSDGKKHLAAIAAVREQISACSVPRRLDSSLECMGFLGSAHARLNWVFAQVETLPMPAQPRTSTDPVLDLFDVRGAALRCCSCADSALSECTKVKKLLTSSEAKLGTWAREVGTTSDDECMLSRLQLRMLK